MPATIDRHDLDHDDRGAPRGRMSDALPDPQRDAAFYQDTVTKRFGAWVIDVVLIALLTGVLTVLSLFTALFVIPVVWVGVSVLYRWAGLAWNSATPGMRIMAVEIRDRRNQPLDAGTALAHTLGYTVSMAVFPLQLVSIVLMLATERRQGLVDHLAGTAALNLRAA